MMNQLLLLLSSFVVMSMTLTAPNIGFCPPIPQHTPATSVHDLRPDDIKVIAALGDSVTAGMVAKNINTTYMTREQFIEYRGASWVMGGDEGASSLANYFKHFSPDLYGYSLGQKQARLCDPTFFCLDSQHDPSIDYLNAAQTGATSKELPEQVDYLISNLGPDTPHANSWKMINVFIGFNDASVSCVPGRDVNEYKNNVRSALQALISKIDYAFINLGLSALQALISKIDYAFINLVGIMHYNDLIYITDQIPGYKKNFETENIDMMDYECFCCRRPDGGVKYIGERVTEFNEALMQVAEDLSGTIVHDMVSMVCNRKRKNVAVVFQPMNTIISTVPPNSLSNMDGYHPNILGYSYLSRALWNQMFLPKNEKKQSDEFDASRPLFCPDETSKLRTYRNI